MLEHDPEEWVPVFGKDHAPTIGHLNGCWRPRAIVVAIVASA
jgi:hypothetical protein